MVVCRTSDTTALESCQSFNDSDTALCTKIERDFLRTLLGGCSTPISALAVVKNDTVIFKGNICSVDGTGLEAIESSRPVAEAATQGLRTANDLLQNRNAQKIMADIRNAKK
jgi:hydroxymethylbilane synthase